jgi:septum site-determining protein MinC
MSIELVTFKGNREGLTAILDLEADFQKVMGRFAERLAEAKGFLTESAVTVDVGPRDLQPEQIEALKWVLARNKLHLRRILAGPRLSEEDSNRREQEVKELEGVVKTQAPWHSRKKKKQIPVLSPGSEQSAAPAESAVIDDGAPALDEQPDPCETGSDCQVEKEEIPVARYAEQTLPRADIISEEQTILIQRTIRSGQRVFYEGNVVVLGDVNPGGEIIAGGNIICMGTFRGVAHAGAMGKKRSVVAALRLEPSQLRIAGFITRAPDGDFSQPQQPEIARVQDGVVIIEKYQAGIDRYLKGQGKGGA